MRIINGIVCCRNELRGDTDILVKDGKISLEPAGDRHDDEIVDAGGSYILPGFIEIHTHGAGLFEFTMGKYNPKTGNFDSSEEIYRENLPKYLRLRASSGVTSLYMGSWAAPISRQIFCFDQLKNYVESGDNGNDGSYVLGGLLEGTFINPASAGAQNPEFVFHPDIELFEKINASNLIKLVNVVPDYDDDSCKLIRHLTDKGISVGAGHTAATCEQFKRAIDAGLKYCIHFLNGSISHSYKSFSGGGAVEAVLREDVYAEIIADGYHVAPRYFRDVLKRKGADKIMAVTDAMFSSQARGINEFEISGIKGKVDETGSFVSVVGRDRLTLFSSVLTMDVAFGNILSWLTTGMDGVWNRRHQAMNRDDAILRAARCSSTNISDMLNRGMSENIETGEIGDGKWADIIIADIAGEQGDYKLNVKDVYVRGKKILDAQQSLQKETCP